MDDDEDKLIREAEFFIALRKIIPENAQNDVKIAKVEECLINGADVNVKFANNSNNTPLHIAVMKGDSKLVKILLKYGAKINMVNDAGKSALDIAKLLPNRAHIVEILTAWEEEIRVRNRQTQTINDTTVTPVSEYNKRPGTANVRGQLYETKLLTMIYFRALRCKQITQIYLGTNVDEIGDIDDVCLRFKTSSEDYVVFLQAKYKHDVKKGKIRYHDLWQATNDFSLLKCYVSYMKIREKFNVESTDDFFRGNYENIKPYFVMYTTIKDDIKGIRKIRPAIDDMVNNLIGTGEKHNIFQFTSEDKNVELIVNTLLMEQMKIMGKRLVQFIQDGKYDMMLTDDTISCFHVVLADKVIQVSETIENGYRTGNFRDEFFTTNDQLLIELRETLYAQAEETVSMTPNEVDIALQIIIHEPTAENISKLIGTVLAYNCANNSLKLINEGTRWIPAYQKRLAALRVTESVINEAIGIAGKKKLQNLNDKLKLPVAFGNLDMTINENKRDSRLDHLANKLSDLIKTSPNKEKIIIQEGVFSQVKKQDAKMLDVNGGIAGAVGNLLISDGDNRLKFNTDGETLPKNARGLFDKLTVLLGDLEIYRFHIELDTFPRLSLHGAEKEKRFAKDFLDSLYFYTLQKKEEDLEETVTTELRAHECSGGFNAIESCIKSSALFLKVHNEIQIWWMSEKKAKYLTRNMPEFDKIFRELKNKGLLIFLNFIYVNDMHKTGLEFNPEAVEVLSACVSSAAMIVVHTDVTMLTCHKLVQHFKGTEDYIFIDIDYVCKVSPHCLEMITTELIDTDIRNVIIVCEDINKHHIINAICACRALKIILVTSNFYQTEASDYVRDDKINLTDLTEASQMKVLENKFIYQGLEVTFLEVFDETTKHLINAKILQKIISKEQITLGQNLELPTYTEIKHCYVPRTLKYNESLSVREVDNLDDYTNMTITTYDEYSEIDNTFSPATLFDHRDLFRDHCQKQPFDVVLLLDGPGMGKSTLLTNLSLETKVQYPKIWIQRINLIDHTTQFHEWQKKQVVVDSTVALRFFCTIGSLRAFGGSVSTLDSKFDIDIDKEEVRLVGCEENDALLSFELKVFLRCFKEGRVIFLFDGYDEVCPVYQRPVTQLLNCFTYRSQMNEAMASESNQHQLCVWIASRSYNDLKEKLENNFGSSYTLLPFSYTDINLFLEKHMKWALKLSSLTTAQMKNIDGFFDYMKKFKSTGHNTTGDLKPTNMPLHSIYVAALKYFKSEIKRTHMNDELIIYVKRWERQMPKEFLKDYLNKNDAITMSGVPLHVYLAMNYFVNQIRDTTTTNGEDAEIKWDLDMNAFAFYERFLETKLKTIWFKEKNCMDIYKPGVITLYEKEKKEFIDTHKKLAYYAVFQRRHMTETEMDEIEKIIENMQFGENKIGLIDRIVNGVPKFVHYTFAEYFAVEHIVDFLKSGEWHKQKRILDLIFSRILAWGMTGVLIILDLKFKLDPELNTAFTGPKVNSYILESLIQQNKTLNASDYLDDSYEIFGDVATPYLDKVVHMELKHFAEFLIDAIIESVNKKNFNDFMDLIEHGSYIDKLFHHEYYDYGLKLVDCMESMDPTKGRVLD